MTKREWEQRLVLQCLNGIPWESFGRESYAVRAWTEARLAADKIAAKDPGFFDPEPSPPVVVTKKKKPDDSSALSDKWWNDEKKK